MSVCPRCDGCRWVCEAHPERPWEGECACGCGALGEPCPVCNRVDQDTEPELPEDFVVEIRRARGDQASGRGQPLTPSVQF